MNEKTRNYRITNKRDKYSSLVYKSPRKECWANFRNIRNELKEENKRCKYIILRIDFYIKNYDRNLKNSSLHFKAQLKNSDGSNKFFFNETATRLIVKRKYSIAELKNLIEYFSEKNNVFQLHTVWYEMTKA